MESIIKLSKEYVIVKQDDLNYVLQKVYTTYGSGKHKSDLPKISRKNLGYYMHVQDALMKYANMVVNDAIDEVSEIDASELAKSIETALDNAVKKMEALL